MKTLRAKCKQKENTYNLPIVQHKQYLPIVNINNLPIVNNVFASLHCVYNCAQSVNMLYT